MNKSNIITRNINSLITIGLIAVVGGGALWITDAGHKRREKEANSLKPAAIDRIADLNNDTYPDMIYTDRNGEQQIMYGYKDGKMYFPQDLAKRISEDTLKSLEGGKR